MSAESNLKTAERLLSKNGDTVTLIERVQIDYDTTTGKGIYAEIPTVTRGFIEPAQQALVGSGVANFGDITILLKAPLIDSTYEVEYKGDRYNIISTLEHISTDNTDIIFKVLCRK